MPNRRNQIAQGARARGLDPLAVLAVASVEGGFNGAVGDQGTSYGPFQLHVGGALPHGRGNNWANSQAGINYALDNIARVARGKHGQAAIDAIVRLFERPANPGAEVQKASSRYGKVGGGPASALGAQAGTPAAGQAAPGNTVDKMALIQALSAQRPDVGGIAQLLAAPQQAPQQPAHPLQQAQAHHHPAGNAINELFYDPLGGIKHGQQTGAIGHHSDHVHVALSSAAAQRAALQHARQLGLHVGEENTRDVHPVHVKNSYHYRILDRKTGLRGAADVSGDPRAMAAYYRWVAQTFGG